MQDKSAELLAQLRDIRGLDPLPWWPIAPGWWFLLAFLILAVCSFYLVRRMFVNWRNARVWREEAKSLLSELKSDSKRPDKEKLASLGILLRKLAIRKHGRAVCAGLEGREWLRWLARHDPNGFDWEREGAVIAESPYAPEEQVLRGGSLERIIRAVEGWVR